MRYIILILCLLFAIPTFAQKKLDKYRVEFTDKNDSPYSVLKPQEYLSPRAIDRRKRYGIAIEENDLPVNPQYLNEVRATGATVLNVSKWFNSAIVWAERDTIAKIEALPFVSRTTPVGKHRPGRNKNKVPARKASQEYERTPEPYGYGAAQIGMLNGHLLHYMGYAGDGMLVAVLDGGFTNVNIMPFFDSLRADGRLLESRDMVFNDNYAYEASSHGSQVLSTMAANLPGLMVGTAPDATYVCIRTEEVGSELVVEEDNWVAGIEYADSLGADVSNTSLGYTTFDQKSMNHTYEDMNGDVALATRAADIAASKGILVVNSAGNSGNDAWKFVGVPADGDSVMAVGGVDRFGSKAGFSSFGPGADGEMKPNVAAMGANTVVASLYDYDIGGSSGTSFASPIMAGMAAALWQAFPEKNNMEIFDAIEQTASQGNTPDYELGFGIPDFFAAYLRLSEGIVPLADASTFIQPKSISDQLSFLFLTEEDELNHLEINVYDIFGKNISSTKKKYPANTIVEETIPDVSDWQAGVYRAEIRLNDTVYRVGIVKEAPALNGLETIDNFDTP